MSQEGDYMVGNRLLTLGVCFLFILIMFSTGCDDKKEGNNTSDNTSEEETIIWEDKIGGIKVQHIEGYVSPEDNSITDIKVYIALHAGVDPVDIKNELVIHFHWIEYEDDNNISGNAELVEANNSEAGPHKANIFGAESLADPHGSFEEGGFLDQDSLLVIYISTMQLQRPPANANFGDNNGLDASSKGLIKFVYGNANPTSDQFNVPWSFPDEGGWVEIY